MRCRLLLPFVLFCTAVLAQEADLASLNIDKLMQDHDAKLIAHTQLLIAAKTEAEREALSRNIPSAADLAPVMLKVAQQHPVEASSTKGLVWLITRATNLPEGRTAVEMLSQPAFAARSGLLDALDYLANAQGGLAEKVLRAIATLNTHNEEKASATLGLGNVMMKNGEAAPAGSPQRQAALEEAAGLYEAVLASYSDVTVRGIKLGDTAAANLFEIRNVSEGSQAPEIDSKDADGNSFKLSDYRGQAVVLVFWGSWCHACHGTLADIQKGIAQLPADKKAVLLAVNTDPTDTLKQLITTEHIECRNWSDGFNRGPISSVWNIHSWPCIFIIDDKGIIKRKNVPRTDVERSLKEVLGAP
ncbi:MAG: resA 14 [Verrucomicrobiaceae bacterium]|nr:resA 14 [Verrucomicrobiaceae bacterium]